MASLDNASSPALLLRRAVAEHKARRHRSALPLYERALAADPRNLQALYLSGLCLLEAGDLARGEERMRRLLALAPDHALGNYALGRALALRGQDDAALGHFEKAAAHEPAYAESWIELSLIEVRRGRLGAAAERLRRGIRHNPRHPALRLNLGNVLHEAGDVAGAEAAWGDALRLAPSLLEAKLNLATGLRRRGRLAEAIGALERIVSEHPSSSAAHYQLGLARYAKGAFAAAAAALERAVALAPGFREARMRLARACQAMCDWDRLDALRPAIDEEIARAHRGEDCLLTPFFSLSLPMSEADRLAVARCEARRIEERCKSIVIDEPMAVCDDPDRPLHVAYLSADFRAHPMAHLTRSMFGLHDRDRFTVSAYSMSPDDGSDARAQIAREVDRFIDVTALSPAEAARRIRADRVDILVDLHGYTRLARPEIPALRCAPLQVAYLGFPGSNGATFCDYILTDRIVTPPAAAADYTETFCVLPHSYYVTDHRSPIADVPVSRAAEGLPEHGFVFCCFCRHYKIERHVFALWMEILSRVPGSVLWLFDNTEEGKSNLKAAAAAQGIDPDRLVFARPVPVPEHLARHRLADLSLDTGTYGAHTTATDALWAGLPLLSRLGDGFASRVGASLLTAVGLPEMIVSSWDDYRDLAVELALDRPRLEAIRRKLAENRTTQPLFDTPRFVRNLERAYRTMWRIKARGEAPRPIEVTED